MQYFSNYFQLHLWHTYKRFYTNHYSVRVDDGVESVSNCEHRAMCKLGSDCVLYQGIRSKIPTLNMQSTDQDNSKRFTLDNVNFMSNHKLVNQPNAAN